MYSTTPNGSATSNGCHFPSNSHQAAELYLRAALAPVPMPPRTKDPGYENWDSLRVTMDTLGQYFRVGLTQNIGILNGSPSSNHHDVDLDCQEAAQAAELLLPHTGWVFGRQSAPRTHRIYKTEQPFQKAQERYCDLDGTVLIELRGSGGLTVYPPSLHKETGEPIRWDEFTVPATVTLANLQTSIKEVAAVSLLARHWVAEGSRQEAFLALAGALLRAKWQTERIERFIQALAALTCDEEERKRVQTVVQTERQQQRDRPTTGWKRLSELLPEGQRVVSRVQKWLGTSGSSQKKLRHIAPFVPFPLHTLPGPVGFFVHEVAVALGCDLSFVAMPVLGVIASAIGNTRVIRLKHSWQEPCVIWTAVVGDSGSLKSPAYSHAIGPLKKVQKRLLQEYRTALEEYDREYADWARLKKEYDRGQGDHPGDPPAAPVPAKVICSDITIEKLAAVLEDNPRGVLMARDELNGWLGSFQRYKDKAGGTDVPNWLEIHRAGAIIYDRKTGDRATVFVDKAAASVTGGIQLGVLSRVMSQDLFDCGLASRLLLCMPPKKKKHWTEQDVHPDTEKGYADLLDRLLHLEFDPDREPNTPIVLHLSPDAKALWVLFYNRYANEQAAAEGELAAAFSKLEGYAARFTMLHHVVKHVAAGMSDACPIDASSVQAGIDLALWFSNEARRIYAALSETEDQRDARTLIEWIRNQGGVVTARQLQRSNSRKYSSTDEAKAALEKLVEAELGEWGGRQTTEAGGRPTDEFHLYDAHDNTDTTPSEGEDDEDDTPPGGSDTTPPPDPPTPHFPSDFKGCVGIVGRRNESQCDFKQSGRQEGEEGLCRTDAEGCVEPAEYTLVQDEAGLVAVQEAIEGSDTIGLDLETTGLEVRLDRIRLLSLATDQGAYLIDCFAVDPTPLWARLESKHLVMHHAAFDLAFLAQRGFAPSKVHCTMLMAQLLTSGTGQECSLLACAKRELGLSLDKSQQKSDWTGRLNLQQLAYAALDAQVTRRLYTAYARHIEDAGLARVLEIEERCLSTLVWMGRQGVHVDVQAWQSLAQEADREAASVKESLDREAPPHPKGALFAGSWNWDSPAQVKQALTLAGCRLTSTGDEALAEAEHPLADLLRKYRAAKKRATTYGKDWLVKHVDEQSLVYPHWRQIGAASGRMACSDPNLQQLPRGDYRRCIAARPGKTFVIADYSQIELRIAAKISGDQALLEAYQRGEDLHMLTAKSVLNIEEVTKEHRQLAKALNFGLLYGMGAKGFTRYAKGNYGLNLTEEEAKRYRSAFFRAYPGLAAWHRKVRIKKGTETQTLCGRRRLLDSKTPDTQRLNTPVQGTGADGLKIALGLLWERRADCPEAVPVLAVHDEIVVECDEAAVEAVTAWLKAAMLDAMTPLVAPVPVEVELKTGKTWHAK